MGANKSKNKKNQTSNNLLNTSRFNQKQLFLNLHESKSLWHKFLAERDWSFLNKLWISLCDIDNENMKDIANMKWPELIQLNLDYNKVTQQGIISLVLNDFPKLQTLSLDRNLIKDEGLKLILDNLGHKLCTLNLMKNGIRGPGLLSNNILNIQYLELCENQNFGNKGVKYLIKANLPFLSTLVVYLCEIGDEGAKYLVKSNWPSLNKIYLSNNKLTAAGYRTIYQCNWKHLTEIQDYLFYPLNILSMISMQAKKVRMVLYLKNKVMQETLIKIAKNRGFF